MINKSHMLRRYKVNNGKIFLKSLLHLEPDATALSLATNTRYNFMTNFIQ